MNTFSVSFFMFYVVHNKTSTLELHTAPSRASPELKYWGNILRIFCDTRMCNKRPILIVTVKIPQTADFCWLLCIFNIEGDDNNKSDILEPAWAGEMHFYIFLINPFHMTVMLTGLETVECRRPIISFFFFLFKKEIAILHFYSHI